MHTTLHTSCSNPLSQLTLSLPLPSGGHAFEVSIAPKSHGHYGTVHRIEVSTRSTAHGAAALPSPFTPHTSHTLSSPTHTGPRRRLVHGPLHHNSQRYLFHHDKPRQGPYKRQPLPSYDMGGG